MTSPPWVIEGCAVRRGLRRRLLEEIGAVDVVASTANAPELLDAVERPR